MDAASRPDPVHYAYRVSWSDEDQEFVGTCAEFASLSWTGITQDDALTGIRDLVSRVVDDLTSAGEPVPQPMSSRA